MFMQGEWSRLRYMQDPRRNGASSIKDLVAVLPRSAHSLYFRDEIGNVSTSSVKRQRERMEVRLQPRFVLFGGWQVRPLMSLFKLRALYARVSYKMNSGEELNQDSSGTDSVGDCPI